MATRRRPAAASLKPLDPAEGDRAAAVAGVLLLLAGAAILMSIITAEALFPRSYSTAQNAISDLGSTFQPGDEVREPSATIFNSAMIVTGLMVAAASLAVRRALPGRALPVSIAAMGTCIFLVGIFPGTVEGGEPSSSGVHPIVALLAFLSGGLAAILAGRRTRPPFRYISILLGVLALLSLALSGWLSDTRLGEGGIERWVAYPTVIWLIAFGGHLLGRASASRDGDLPPPA